MNRRNVVLDLMLILWVLLCGLIIYMNAVAYVTAGGTNEPTAYPPPDGGMIYLPAVQQPQIRLGVQLEQLNTEWVTPGGVVYHALRWHDIESVRGVYDWQSLPFAGYKLILDIKTSPAWAIDPGRKICSAPKPEYYPDLARFILAAIEQYHPVAVSLWNEPDVPESLAPYSEFYGCIDNPVDYSDMTMAVYDALTGRVPLVAGEFALDNIPSDYAADFISRTAGHFDILSFHSYSWTPDTGRVSDRITWLRQYYSGPLWLSETSMLCEVNCGDEFEQQQDEYLRAVYALPLDFMLWYTGWCNTWRNSDTTKLVDGVCQPKSVWYTYSKLTER